MDHFAGLDVSVKGPASALWITRASVSEGCERTRCAVDGSEETLPTTSSRATVAMAVRRSRRSRVTCGVC